MVPGEFESSMTMCLGRHMIFADCRIVSLTFFPWAPRGHDVVHLGSAGQANVQVCLPWLWIFHKYTFVLLFAARSFAEALA